MSHQGKTALLLGLCTVLAACDDTSTRDLTGPEPTARAAEPRFGLAAMSALAFAQLSAGTGDNHSCGIATDSRLYCWGYNSLGSVGDGTTTQRLSPVPIGGTLRFRQVSAGGDYTCGLTTDQRAYCWGENDWGQLGDGTTINRLTPVPVRGTLRFRQLSAGAVVTCGVTTDDRAYCWGYNETGTIGDGTLTTFRLRPVPIGGALRFRQVSPGGGHTCGVTTDDRAYCWGWNYDGAVGDSSRVTRLVPTPVAGGLRFRQVDTGESHSCGVTVTGRAYCWGYNSSGQVGDGKTVIRRFWPRAVAGGLSFRAVNAGFSHTCGITTLNRAYCWGNNQEGGLGDGTLTHRYAPVPVAGGHLFDQVGAGFLHTCARTPDGVGYCWGDNFGGPLGDGTTTDRLKPRAIAPPAS